MSLMAGCGMCLLFYHPLPTAVNGLLTYRLGLPLRTAPDVGRIFYRSLTPRAFRARPLLPEFHHFPVPQIPDVCLTIQCRVVKLADAMAWPHASQSTSALVARPKRLRESQYSLAFVP
jgi:hypothetical protein